MFETRTIGTKETKRLLLQFRLDSSYKKKILMKKFNEQKKA